MEKRKRLILLSIEIFFSNLNYTFSFKNYVKCQENLLKHLDFFCNVKISRERETEKKLSKLIKSSLISFKRNFIYI